METWHNRLQKALTARGRTWAELVTATGLKKPSVYAWKPSASKKTVMINGDNASTVCAFLGINHDWLFNDEGPSGLEEDNKYNKDAKNQTLDQLRQAYVERLSKEHETEIDVQLAAIKRDLWKIKETTTIPDKERRAYGKK